MTHSLVRRTWTWRIAHSMNKLITVTACLQYPEYVSNTSPRTNCTNAKHVTRVHHLDASFPCRTRRLPLVWAPATGTHENFQPVMISAYTRFVDKFQPLIITSANARSNAHTLLHTRIRQHTHNHPFHIRHPIPYSWIVNAKQYAAHSSCTRRRTSTHTHNWLFGCKS